MSSARVAFDAFVLDTYCALPVEPGQLRRAAEGLTRLRARREEVRATLRAHKGFPAFQFTLSRLAGDPVWGQEDAVVDTASWFLPEAAECETHQQLLRAELAWLAGLPAASRSRVAVIKGLNNARFYPDPTPRWSRDLDLYVPDWESAYALLTALRARGYLFDEQECPWFKAEPERGRQEYGQLFLVRGQQDSFSRVDIHFGTYSVGFGEYLSCQLTEFYEAVGEQQGGFHGLNPTGTLLVMFAHALSDGYVSVKDANDAAAIALTREDVDFDRLGLEIRRHALAPQARLLAEHLAAAYRSDRIRAFAAALAQAVGSSGGGRGPLRGRALWRMHDRNWHRRAVVNTTYALRASLRSHRGLPCGLKRAVQCFVFYDRRLSVLVGRRSAWERVLLGLMARTDLTRWRLRPDACPTLIHTGHPALAGKAGSGRPMPPYPSLRATRSAGVRVGGTYPNEQIVAIGTDVFACSWDQRLGNRQWAAARQVAEGLRVAQQPAGGGDE